jgi:phytoene dehydrogenase-like protein
MAHHSIGDVGNGQVGAWATVVGGMGAVATALEASARSFGAEIRVDAPVERILESDGRVRGVVLTSGEELVAPIVVAATHPQITFLRHLDAGQLPEAFVEDIRAWKSRSGTVKINLALDRAPVFAAKPDQADLTGGFELAHSIEYLERAFEEARSGRAATAPFSDGSMPTFADPSLAPAGSTSSRCSRSGVRPSGPMSPTTRSSRHTPTV